MSPLPLLVSLPHAGLWVPPEVADLCVLTLEQIVADGDEGAAQIYGPLEATTTAFVTTGVARAIVDMNRAADDIRKDGVVKTHTCWEVPVYRRPLTASEIAGLIADYHRPYHRQLTWYATSGAVLGVDCHTMAAVGPPVGPDPGVERPQVCLGNGAGTCPADWLERLADCFRARFPGGVTVNTPFSGGYVIRGHAGELPWVQIELSRGPFASDAQKADRVREALTCWCEWHGSTSPTRRGQSSIRDELAKPDDAPSNATNTTPGFATRSASSAAWPWRDIEGG
jgi:formiminoglutamase